MNTASPKKKNIVIVIDESFSMGISTRIQDAKEAAEAVITTLSPRDWVSISISVTRNVYNV